MDDLIIGSEALAAGHVTRQTLRTKYVKLHYNVYAPVGMQLDAADRARAAWLWSRRQATLVGHSAAAMHGALWLPTDAPAELARVRQPAPTGIVIHTGAIADDEVCLRASIDCTTPARTAYDIGRRVPPDNSIIRIDALLNATRCTVEDVDRIADRYPGARGIRRLRAALARPTTQIKVGKRRIDMGWPQWKVGVEYDGEQHWTDPGKYAEDIERLEYLAAQGWLIVRVSGRQLHRQPQEVVRRVRDALTQRGYPLVSVN